MIKDTTIIGAIVDDSLFDVANDTAVMAMLFGAYADAAAEHSGYWAAYHAQRAHIYELAADRIMNNWLILAYCLDAPLP